MIKGSFGFLVLAIILSNDIVRAAEIPAACTRFEKQTVSVERAQTAREHGASVSETHHASWANLEAGLCNGLTAANISIEKIKDSAMQMCQMMSHGQGTCIIWDVDGDLTDEATRRSSNSTVAASSTPSVDYLAMASCQELLGHTYGFQGAHKALVSGDTKAGSGTSAACVMSMDFPSESDAIEAAKSRCAKEALGNCVLFAMDDLQISRPDDRASSGSDASQGMREGHASNSEAQQTDAVAEIVNQAAASIAQSAADRNAAKQARRDQQSAMLLQQQQLQQQRQSAAAQQSVANQQRQAYQQQQAAAQTQASAQSARSSAAAPTAASRAPAPTQSAPQLSYTYADAVVPDNGFADQYGQVPNIYAVNVTNTGQVRLYCTADAKAQTYNQTIKCPDPTNCQGATSWYTNSGSSYVSPGSTNRVVGIRYYAGQGSYTVSCQSSQ